MYFILKYVNQECHTAFIHWLFWAFFKSDLTASVKCIALFAFCDGHVAGIGSDVAVFSGAEPDLAQWNIDHQPHSDILYPAHSP